MYDTQKKFSNGKTFQKKEKVSNENGHELWTFNPNDQQYIDIAVIDLLGLFLSK
jgi:hypothetical protein